MDHSSIAADELGRESETGLFTRGTGQRVRAILIGSAGNLIEWYDIYVFTAFQFYFAGSFFTGVSPERQQLFASIVFAMGFVARPFGSVLFGGLADRLGRRRSMILSILMTCFGSLLIAVTPSAATIGIAAPILLLVARLLQGLSQGGELCTSIAYLSEMADPKRRGFYSGIWQTTTLGGQCLALIPLLIIQQLLLTPDQLKDWGWRLPFLFGAILAVSAFVMRRDLKETDHFLAARKALGETGTAKHFFRLWKSQLLVVGFTAGGISAYYTYTTYMQKFIRQSVHLSDTATTEVAAGAMVFAVILQPLMGSLSDRIGRKPLLMMFGILGTTCTYPLLKTLHGLTSPFAVFLLLCGAWVIASGYTSITAVVKAEMFPTSVRAMGIGVPYAITAALFGGTVDSVAQYFKTELHYEEGFYWYASALIFLSFLVYAFMPDSRKHSKMEQHA